MFGRRKVEEKSPRERKPRGNLPLLGFEADMDDDDGDGDLEKELAALVGGGGAKKKAKPGGKQVSPDELNAMVAAAMKDFNDDDLSDTEDDPDLLAELEDIQDDDDDSPSGASDGFREGIAPSFTQTIMERLSLYREAESIAVANGDTSRARRFNRGVKTLVDLERRAKAGHPIREDDIPPLISVGKRKEAGSSSDSTPASEAGPPVPQPSSPPPAAPVSPPAAPVSPAAPSTQSPPAPAAPSRALSAAQSQVSQIHSQLAEITAAREQFKRKALAARSAGDKDTALTMMKFIKTCDGLAAQVKQGNSVDLSVIRKDNTQPQVVVSEVTHEVAQTSPEPAGDSEHSDQSSMTILESLEQRRDKYAEEEAKAKEAGNESKARRMGRIKKQYLDAIKMHKVGRPIPRADLPDPPGFPPIPTSDPPQTRKTPSPRPPLAEAPSPAASPQQPPSATPPRQQPVQAPEAAKKGPSPARQTSVMSVQEKQLASLVKKQQLFKEAATKAKQQGQIDTAKDYLRQALSFNKLIEASKAGLPVDMGTLPVPPQLQVKTDMDFEIVSREECSVVGDREEMFSKLEQDIISQVKMCMTNRTYFKEVGDIASSNKFEQMALNAKKDLDAVRNEFKRGGPVPKFHYETRAFSRVVSNTDLTDNDLELSILNGINYVVKNPKEVDTYIKWEFPFPRDSPTIDKTAVVKDTNNPQYDFSQKLVINPRDKTFQRVVKRGSVKMEVWAKGGFLRSDTLLGTANMKLAPLETSCVIHDSFDLYDGRKPVGGKVEAKIRIRNGVLAKQIEQVQEKWLVVQF